MRIEFKKTLGSSTIQTSDWNSSAWQMRHSLKTKSDFEKYFSLSDSETLAFDEESGRQNLNSIEKLFKFRCTPYYASLAQNCEAIRTIVVPKIQEYQTGWQSLSDPLLEKENNPVPRVIHRYPDRALLLVTDFCSVYCRYCTRKHFTGRDQAFLSESDLIQALDYFQQHTEIREVILSGGDPLTLGTAQLEQVLFRLRQIEHIEIIRIGSRMPVVCPQRIDIELVKTLRKYGPVFLMTHFNHPDELSFEAAEALSLFVDHGIPVFNQSVLLKEVNNDPEILRLLSRKLLYLRVKPYYLFICDPVRGTNHLKVPLAEAEAIQKKLWGSLSGLGMPNFSLDIPQGGGKISIVPNFEIARDEKSRTYCGFDGITASYFDPAP